MRTFRPSSSHPVLYGLTAKQISEWARVTERTARRWKRGEDPPFTTLQWIEILNTGDLGMLHPNWQGWCIKDGQLVSPDEQSFSPGDVLAVTFWQQLARHYQVEQRIPRQGDWVEERWVPATEVEAG